MDPAEIHNALPGQPVAFIDTVIIGKMHCDDLLRKPLCVGNTIFRRRIPLGPQGGKKPLQRAEAHIRVQRGEMVGIQTQLTLPNRESGRRR